MKKFIYIISIILFTASSSLAQWTWQNPLPQGNSLYSVCNTDSLNYYACGDMGTILKTTNGGLNWTVYIQPECKSYFLRAVQFVNQFTGYVCGDHGSFLKTTNAGLNWSKLYLSNTLYNYFGMNFLNKDTGWVCGSQSSIKITYNGGLTWYEQVNTGMPTYYSIKFVNKTTGFATGAYPGLGFEILKTTNAGITWVLTGTNNQYIWSDNYSLDFLNPLTGWYTGSTRTARSTDGGSNFQDFTVAVSNYIKFFDATTGWIFGPNNQSYGQSGYTNIRISTNAGANWVDCVSNNTNTLNSAIVYNRYKSLVVGNYGTITKSNDNINFINNQLNTFNCNEILFLDQYTGWSVGYQKILCSTNGGNNWLPYSGNFSNNYNFSDINFINNQTGYICGNLGYSSYPAFYWSNIILKTTNSGANWITMYNQSGALRGFFKINFLDEANGWLVDSYGTIKFTTNSGVNWNDNFNTGSKINSMLFLNNQTGWVAGGISVSPYGYYNTVIYRTTNSGTNWTGSNSFPGMINSIYFINNLTGWAVGRGTIPDTQSKIILKTTNGGDNWAVINFVEQYAFNDVKFISNDTGYIAGENGGLMYTTNAGLDWLSASVTRNTINNIYFLNNKTGWLCGNNGTILKTTNAGIVNLKINEKTFPNKYSLSQNYPNPFNPTTKISFALPKAGLVTIKVFNVLGKELETLVNESLKPGTYEAAFDGSKYPSGVYFYRLTFRHGGSSADGFTETKRMVLIK